VSYKWSDIYKPPFWHEDGMIFFGDRHNAGHALDVRGWGCLTDQSRLGLSEQQASNLQNQFAEHVVKLLNSNAPQEDGNV
jgi:hypothetical protein